MKSATITTILLSFLVLIFLNIYLYSSTPIKTKFEEDCFRFDVIKASYCDGKPVFVGKHGGITFRPSIHLKSRVFRIKGDNRKEIGIITQISWDQLKGRLDIEFSPIEDVEIFVGEELCVKLNQTN